MSHLTSPRSKNPRHISLGTTLWSTNTRKTVSSHIPSYKVSWIMGNLSRGTKLRSGNGVNIGYPLPAPKAKPLRSPCDQPKTYPFPVASLLYQSHVCVHNIIIIITPFSHFSSLSSHQSVHASTSSSIAAHPHSSLESPPVSHLVQLSHLTINHKQWLMFNYVLSFLS